MKKATGPKWPRDHASKHAVVVRTAKGQVSLFGGAYEREQTYGSGVFG